MAQASMGNIRREKLHRACIARCELSRAIVRVKSQKGLCETCPYNTCNATL